MFKPKLVFITVPANRPKDSTEFFSNLFGLEFGRTSTAEFESYHALLNSKGLQLAIQPWFPHRADKLTPYFAVPSLKESLDKVLFLGGKLVSAERELKIPNVIYPSFQLLAETFYQIDRNVLKPSIGRGLIISDPSDNHIGLIEFEEFMHPMYCIGKYGEVSAENQILAHRFTCEFGKLFAHITEST